MQLGEAHRRCSIIPTNRAKRWRASWGPGDDSGWYCTPKACASSTSMPSTVPSFRFTWETRALWPSERSSTAKPWFWEVMSTLPVRRSCTGWFAPRWPNFSL